MELALMGPVPSYRLLHSLFLPPLPYPSTICLTARRASKCTPIWRASSVVEICGRPCDQGYLAVPGRVGMFSVRCGMRFYGGFGRGPVGDVARSGVTCIRNSRTDHGVVGSSWTKESDGSASVKGAGMEQERTDRRSSPSKSAGNVNNNTEDNKDSSHRTKQNFGKPRSKFDAPRSRPEHSGRAQHSSSRSYNSSSRAKSSERVQGTDGRDVRIDSKTSMAQNGKNHGTPDSSYAKGGKQPRAKNKQYAPEQDLRRALDMCSKHADVKQALEIYDKTCKEGKIAFNQYNYNIILYLCSSAATDSLKPQKSGNERRGSEQVNHNRGPLDLSGIVESKNEALTEPKKLEEEQRILYMKRGFEVYEAMKSQGVPPNEATFTAVARLAVAKEDGDLAFDMVKQMAEANLSPRLRSYAPALYTYCKLKNHKKAFEVDDHMKKSGVALEESELEALLKVSVGAGLEDKVYSLLHRLRTTVRDVSPSAVEVIQQWFTSSAAATAGKSNWEHLPGPEYVKKATESCGGGWHGLGWLGRGTWEVKSSVVDDHGVCQECGEPLATIDLDPQETEMFAQSLSRMACQREAKNNEFKKFQGWLDRHGPFDAIVDGANVGLYNSNTPNGGFNFYQLNSVVTGIQKRLGLKREPLILLHHRRTKGGPADSSFAARMLSNWKENNSIYTTPTGSNDDWYWLYAAVRFRCVLVTNDEMRDHLFSLLGNDFFPKWKERHQVRYTINREGLVFHMPPPFSTVIQESHKGSWHVPKSGKNDEDVLVPREWLCVTRTGHLARSDTKSEEEMIASPNITRESSLSEVQAEAAINSELKGISVPSEGIQSPKPRKSRKSTSKSLSKSSPESSAFKSSEDGKLAGNIENEVVQLATKVEKLAGDIENEVVQLTTKVEKLVSEVQAQTETILESKDVTISGEEIQSPKPRKSRKSSSKASSKSLIHHPSETGMLEEQSTAPQKRRSISKKARSPKSALLQKLEAADEDSSGKPIDFQI
nr:hypothetical protein PHYPA_013989 [Physcomitrium patens]BAN18185.1 pentatricopeptide repeat protein [Physcomitrium patens]